MTKKRKIQILTGLLLLCIIVAVFLKINHGDRDGREVKQDTEVMGNETVEEESLVSKEELFASTELKPEEFEQYGFDPEDFIKTYSVTKRFIEEEPNDIRLEFDAYVYYNTEHEYYEEEYAYLLKTPLSTLEEGMLEDVKTVYIISVYEGSHKYYLFDFAKGRICENEMLEYTRKAVPEDKEALLQLLKESGIGQMKKSWFQKRRIGEWPDNFEIVIETEDGRTAHYKAKEEVPEEMEKLRGKYNENLNAIVNAYSRENIEQ